MNFSYGDQGQGVDVMLMNQREFDDKLIITTNKHGQTTLDGGELVRPDNDVQVVELEEKLQKLQYEFDSLIELRDEIGDHFEETQIDLTKLQNALEGDGDDILQKIIDKNGGVLSLSQLKDFDFLQELGLSETERNSIIGSVEHLSTPMLPGDGYLMDVAVDPSHVSDVLNQIFQQDTKIREVSDKIDEVNNNIKDLRGAEANEISSFIQEDALPMEGGLVSIVFEGGEEGALFVDGQKSVSLSNKMNTVAPSIPAVAIENEISGQAVQRDNSMTMKV